MAKVKRVRSIMIEPAANGHSVTANFESSGAKKSKYPYDDMGESEHTVHTDCCDAASKVHDLLAAHDGLGEHAIDTEEGEEDEA